MNTESPHSISRAQRAWGKFPGYRMHQAGFEEYVRSTGSSWDFVFSLTSYISVDTFSVEGALPSLYLIMI